jgi:hypothetical protein
MASAVVVAAPEKNDPHFANHDKNGELDIKKWHVENWHDLMHAPGVPGPKEYREVTLWGCTWQGGPRNEHDSKIIRCLYELTEVRGLWIDVMYNDIDPSYYLELFAVIASLKKLTEGQFLFPNAPVDMKSIVPAMFLKPPPLQFDTISAGFCDEKTLYDFLEAGRSVLENLTYLTIMPGYGTKGLKFACSETTLGLILSIVKTNKKIKAFTLFGAGHSDTVLELFADAFKDHLYLDKLYIEYPDIDDFRADNLRTMKCMEIVNRCKQNRRLAFPEEMIPPLVI